MTSVEPSLSNSTVVKESMSTFRDSFLKVKPSDPLALHEVIIAVAQSNLDVIKTSLYERSTPGSELYQQWLNYDEIGTLVRNNLAIEAIENWLKSESVDIVWQSPHGEYLKAKATIETWERILFAKFYVWHDTADTGKTLRNEFLHRSDSYSIPIELSQSISAIFNTCQVPPVLRHYEEASPLDESFATSASKCSSKSPCQVDINFLRSLYGIPSTPVSENSTVSQAVFETQGESFSQNDLARFQSVYKLPSQVASVKGMSSSITCTNTNCYEGSLDIQYIMAVAPGANSVFWYAYDSGDNFLNFLLAVAATPSPPSSLSISWGANEYSYSNSFLDAFNTEAMKISVMGITILAASGDTGVSGTGCQCTLASDSSSSSKANTWSGNSSWVGRGYFPIYPASSPYVVSVGATQGPEYGSVETVCSSATSGVAITSGGGFSAYFSTPDYQATAVSSYLTSPVGQSATPGYNPRGRGYPDISFIGNMYPAYVGGTALIFSGTSASTPVMAALITLINSERQALGLSTVGFINPTLYANAAKFNDIATGANNCCKGGVACCASGFSAAAGWDPASGLGSITYANLASMFVPSSPLISVTNKTVASTGGSSPVLSMPGQIGISVGGFVFLLLIFVFATLRCLRKTAGSEKDISGTYLDNGVDEGGVSKQSALVVQVDLSQASTAPPSPESVGESAVLSTQSCDSESDLQNGHFGNVAVHTHVIDSGVIGNGCPSAAIVSVNSTRLLGISLGSRNSDFSRKSSSSGSGSGNSSIYRSNVESDVLPTDIC